MFNPKSDIDVTAAAALLEHYWGCSVTDVTFLTGGNLSSVFSFNHSGSGYVIRFSGLEDAFQTERYIADLLSAQGVPYPRVIGQGTAGSCVYAISERVEGIVVADLPEDGKSALLPDLVRVIAKMNQVKLDSSSSGYGWIDPDGNGRYPAWERFLVSFFQEDQTGTFWEGWHDLFHTSFLEKDVFEECYARLMSYAPYNAPHRYFVHGDCHAWNILSDGRGITGIIDGNCVYGDFLIDVSIAEGVIPGRNVILAFRDHYERLGIPIPDFKERMLGARYFKGLDGLRFYAKMGWKPAYKKLKSDLLALV
ncbi:phosphotransferase family protein [Paenibacillus sp. MBLB4367]|uniref:phosphotransferase family protein n=1 Tax=Paenibacillus sp. MBLB4367 TaxID=3384767 RepID=UPI0039080593